MKELKAEAHVIRREGLGKQVDIIEHRQVGLSTPLYWNKEDTYFGVYLADKSFRHKEATVVKKYAFDAMTVIGTLEWTPVILVMDLVDPGSYSYSGKMLKQREVSFHFDRFYATEMPDGSVRAVEWDVPPEKRTKSFTNVYCWDDGKKIADLPYVSKDGREFFFPYTEEMWVGLSALAEGIDQLRKKLRHLLRQDDVQQVISNVGANMLKMLTDAPPVEEPKKE